MGQRNNKLTWREQLDYPILLLAICSLVNIRSLIGLIIRYPLSIFGALLNSLSTVAIIAILIFLWLHKINQCEKAKFVIASIFAVLSVYTIYSLIQYFINIFPHITLDINYVVTGLPSLLADVFSILLFTILAINLLKKSPKYLAFYLLAVLFIFVMCFFGILCTMVSGMVPGSIHIAIECFMNVIFVLALWYVPASLDGSKSAEITKGKVKALLAIFCVSLVVMVIAFVGAGGGSSGGDTSYYIDYNRNGKQDLGEGVFWEDSDGNTHFYD